MNELLALSVRCDGSAVYRREQNRRAFLCDPDVFLLRDCKTKLTEHQRIALAT